MNILRSMHNWRLFLKGFYFLQRYCQNPYQIWFYLFRSKTTSCLEDSSSTYLPGTSSNLPGYGNNLHGSSNNIPGSSNNIPGSTSTDLEHPLRMLSEENLTVVSTFVADLADLEQDQDLEDLETASRLSFFQVER